MSLESVEIPDAQSESYKDGEFSYKNQKVKEKPITFTVKTALPYPTYDSEIPYEYETIVKGTDIIPVFQIFTNEKKTEIVQVPIIQCESFPTKENNKVGTLWNVDFWYMLVKTEENNHGLGYVNYDSYWQEQNYLWDLEKILQEEQLIQKEMADDDTEPKTVRYEDETLTARAETLYDQIILHRDEIVNAMPTGDYFKDEILKDKYIFYFGKEPDLFNKENNGLVYEEAWEATNIMTHLIDTNAQPESLFGVGIKGKDGKKRKDYLEINEELQKSYGTKCARLVFELALFLSKHIHRVEEPEEEELLESTLEGTIPDAN